MMGRRSGDGSAVRWIMLLVMVTAALALLASPAFGASTEKGYGGKGAVESLVVQGGNAGGEKGRVGGGLPFTGLDLVLLAGGGAILIGVGAGLSRATAARRT